MLLETALKDYLKSSLQGFPWPTSIAGWRDPASRGAQREFLSLPKGAPCVWGSASCQPLDEPHSSHHCPPCPLPPVSAQLLSKAWLKWHHWRMVWKNLWPTHFTSRLHLWLRSDQKAGPHCQNSPPIYLKWVCPLLPMSKIQISLSLYVHKYVCVCSVQFSRSVVSDS